MHIPSSKPMFNFWLVDVQIFDNLPNMQLSSQAEVQTLGKRSEAFYQTVFWVNFLQLLSS